MSQAKGQPLLTREGSFTFQRALIRIRWNPPHFPISFANS